MTHPAISAGLVALITCVFLIWHRLVLRRTRTMEQAQWRRSLARGLSEAATNTASLSVAAAEALTLVAEAIQCTGAELGTLESSLLRERVLAGTALDDKRAREALLLRMATMLHGVTGARELIRVMLPETRRDTSLRDDALATLDAAARAFKGDPPHQAS
jgi:hypothetical protein